LLATVLERVEGVADEPAIRGAPLQLDEGERHIGRHPDEGARRLAFPHAEGSAARAAQRRPLAPASDADRRERKVQQPPGHRAGPGDSELYDTHEIEG
jgi:hypothetical protein